MLDNQDLNVETRLCPNTGLVSGHINQVCDFWEQAWKRAVQDVVLDQLVEHAQRREGTKNQGGTFQEVRFLSCTRENLRQISTL